MSGGDEAEVPGAGEALVAALEAAVAERDVRLVVQDARLAAQDAQLAAQDAQLARLAEQDAKLIEQEAKLAELAAQVAKLTELLGRNSSNSHLPPSSDGPGAGSRGGTSGKPRGKSGRARGGQKNHRGNHRALLPPESVNTFVDLFPPVCLGCTHPLPRKADVAACRYQQLELRDHRPHVTEWRRHEVECERCGASTRAQYDRTQLPNSAFGPCLSAVVAMLTGA